jgi:hypothetical protein
MVIVCWLALIGAEINIHNLCFVQYAGEVCHVKCMFSLVGIRIGNGLSISFGNSDKKIIVFIADFLFTGSAL